MVHFSCISATKEAVDAIEIEVDVNSEISPREMLTMNAPNKLERDMQGLIMFTVEIWNSLDNGQVIPCWHTAVVTTSSILIKFCSRAHYMTRPPRTNCQDLGSLARYKVWTLQFRHLQNALSWITTL